MMLSALVRQLLLESSCAYSDPKCLTGGMLWHPGAYGERTSRNMLTQAETAARSKDLQVQLLEVHSADDFGRAFATITQADALLTFPSLMLFLERERIARLAQEHPLPTISVGRDFVELGGLISFGANVYDLIRRATTYGDRILKGANPADLPVEQPTKFEMVINLKTAKAFGFTIPQSILLRADEVIE